MERSSWASFAHVLRLVDYATVQRAVLEYIISTDRHLWWISYSLLVIDTTQTIVSQWPPFAIYSVGT